MTTTAMNWTGATELKALLRPVEELQTHPHNPRRGDPEAIAESLSRFGQLKPIVVDGEGVILAGNQVYTVAIERLGWSHVAAVTADNVTDDVEAYLFLVADNHAADEAAYDEREAKIAADGLTAMVAEARTALETEQDAARRDQLAEQIRGLETAASVLEARSAVRQAGGIVQPEDIEMEHFCQDPECGYRWRGNA